MRDEEPGERSTGLHLSHLMDDWLAAADEREEI